MCGIVGYIGPNEAAPILVDSLRRLEYRGYDSAGLAVSANGEGLQVRRAAGKLRNLEEALRMSPVGGNYGIGHTRWATHGRPTEENAHPHRDSTGDIVVVHNGIVENYLTLKAELEQAGRKFTTDTDTEVIAHLVADFSKDGTPLEEAVRLAIGKLQGVFALATLSRRDRNKIVAARNGPPAVVGIGNDEYFVASDVPAILHHTRDMLFLADGDIAVLTPGGVRVMDFDGRTVNRALQHVLWDPVMAEKGGYRHFMLKEVFEQPRAVRDTLLGRIGRESGEVFLDEMEISEPEFAAIEQVRMVACGTSWHAALAGKFMIEQLAAIPVEVDYGSEFRYRDPIVGDKTLTVLISQSGETADTLAAQREAIRKGSKTLAICNVLGSMLTREAAGTIYTHAGPEIGVALDQGLYVSVDGAVSAVALPRPRQRSLGTAVGEANDRRAALDSEQARNRAQQRRPVRSAGANALSRRGLPIPWTRRALPDCTRRGVEAQGNFLYPRRGIPGG